jgi:hypothetical protein
MKEGLIDARLLFATSLFVRFAAASLELVPMATFYLKLLSEPAVLADLLREHFRGCALVLVNGQIEAPLLTADGEQWRVDPPGRLLTADQLAGALRRPRPWE